MGWSKCCLINNQNGSKKLKHYKGLAGYLTIFYSTLSSCSTSLELYPINRKCFRIIMIIRMRPIIARHPEALTSWMPPDISLPRAMTALSGDMQVRFFMIRCSVGIPNAIPYSSQPLFTAMQSSPETMKQSSILVLEQESAQSKNELVTTSL